MAESNLPQIFLFPKNLYIEFISLTIAIIPMLVTEMEVPTIRITGMVLQAAAIRMEAVTWATVRSLRTEEPRKAVLTSQMPLHRIDPLETRCTSSRTETPSMANSRAGLPETGLPTSKSKDKGARAVISQICQRLPEYPLCCICPGNN